MNVRLRSLVLASAALLAPSLAFGVGTIEGFYGIGKPPGTSFRGATSDPHVFRDSEQLAGGDVMFNITWLQFGAIGDQMWAKNKASITSLGGLLWAKLAAGPVRVDLMGEVGGHRYGNLQNLSSNKDQWFAYLGLRPGVAFKLSAPDTPGFLIGVWGFARWDLSSKRTGVVTASNVGETSPGSIKLGGASYGATVRLGFDF